MAEESLTATIVSVSRGGECATARLSRPIFGRNIAIIDHRFRSREKIINRLGGLKKDAVLTGVRASLDGNILVITSCN